MTTLRFQTGERHQNAWPHRATEVQCNNQAEKEENMILSVVDYLKLKKLHNVHYI